MFLLTIVTVRFSLKDLEKAYEKTEDDIKAVQSVGQIIGEVMKQLDDERCEYPERVTFAHFLIVFLVIVKASSGPRYVVSYRPTLPAAKLQNGTRVSLDMTTLTIMRILPREVDPLVYKMSLEDPGGASFAGIGGLGDQIRELREVRGLANSPYAPHDRTGPGYRVTATEPRAFPTGGHQATKGCPTLWPTRYWQDTACPCCRRHHADELPEGRLFRNRRQVYWRVSEGGARDVRVCKRARALCYLHG